MVGCIEKWRLVEESLEVKRPTCGKLQQVALQRRYQKERDVKRDIRARDRQESREMRYFFVLLCSGMVERQAWQSGCGGRPGEDRTHPAALQAHLQVKIVKSCQGRITFGSLLNAMSTIAVNCFTCFTISSPPMPNTARCKIHHECGWFTLVKMTDYRSPVSYP